jgi:hypothetical protein
MQGKIVTQRQLINLLKKVAKLRYLETAATYQKLINEEIKRLLNSGYACCCSVQKLLSSLLLSKNLKVKIYKSIIFPLVFDGYKTEGFHTRVLRGIFDRGGIK